MIQVSTPNDFSGLFNSMHFNTVQLNDISDDYTLIVWWAGAMHKMGVSLAALLGYLAQHPQWDPEDNAFKSLRSDLEKKLASVAADTKSQFSEPWGLLAMYLASGQLASKSLRIICAKLTLLA
jgi:hypothetical protein